VAKNRSAEYPYQWPDGSWHSRPQSNPLADQAWGAIGLYQDAQRNGQATPTLEAATRLLIDNKPPTEGAPPPGTYDSILDYNAGAGTRGLAQTQNDAQTLFDQGQEDYGLGLGDITRNRDWRLEDLGTSRNRLAENYYGNTAENERQYGILGRRQAEGAAQRGVTSAGLLGKSNAVRAENQGRDQSLLDRSWHQGLEDIGKEEGRTNTLFDRSKTGLDLGNARQFGGFNGALINNPLTGKPYTGSLATGVQRAFTENEAFQGGILGQKVDQAKAGGYVAPLTGTYQALLRKLRGY
jgi:hypothetical protein